MNPSRILNFKFLAKSSEVFGVVAASAVAEVVIDERLEADSERVPRWDLVDGLTEVASREAEIDVSDWMEVAQMRSSGNRGDL